LYYLAQTTAPSLTSESQTGLLYQIATHGGGEKNDNKTQLPLRQHSYITHHQKTDADAVSWEIHENQVSRLTIFMCHRTIKLSL
jgi:hypothetical protein